MRITNVVLLVAIIIVIVLLIGRFNFSEADFSIYNPAWNGITQFPNNNSVNLLYSISDISGVGENNLVLIINPTRNFTADESIQALSFMYRGGTIVLMDDFGTANTLLNDIGSPITIYQAPLCDDNDYYKRPSFPVITTINQTGLMSNVTKIMLNHPTALNVTVNAIILATSSSFSWIDANANTIIDQKEVYGKYPVMARADYGAGQLYVASDPDILVNVMINEGNNSVFASNIMKSGNVYLDISHGQKIPPLATVFYMVRYDLVAQLLCSLLIILIGYAVYRRASIKKAIFGPEQPKDPISKKQSMINFMKAKLPVKESDIKELNKKL
ncbi:MAG: DUF4350 domain-containing protein [Methanocella sp.]